MKSPDINLVEYIGITYICKTMRIKMRYIIIFLLLPSLLFAQKVYLSKYIYGNFVKDDNHRLEIFNESADAVNVGGYLIVTRAYMLRLPEKTILLPYSSLRMGKMAIPPEILEIQYQKLQDFLVRFPTDKEIADYIVLFDKNLRIIDAVYFSRLGRTRFLPDRDELITGKRDKILFEIPPANHPMWQSLDVTLDPAMALVQIGGKWQITSRKKNLFPAVEYADLQANAIDGIVTLKWHTTFEEDCFAHIIERGVDGEHFEPVEKIAANKTSTKLSEYVFYDKNVQKDTRYYYRIKNTDKFRNIVYSPIVETSTAEISSDFNLHFVQDSRKETELSFRFSVNTAQHILIRLTDEHFRDKGILFDDFVEKNSPLLIKFAENLPTGKYYIIAEMEKQRLYKVWEVQ